MPFSLMVLLKFKKNDQNLKYVYGLSDKSINILGTDNDPKLDLFLNQILR